MKKIGIVAWKTGENSFGTTLPYLEYFSNFGQVVMLMPGQAVDTTLDLLVLSGGKDVNTLRYGDVPHFRNSDPNPYLEWFDEIMLPQYIKLGMPIFGICRGFQTLNVTFGGTLTQHYVHTYSTKSRQELVHELQVMNVDHIFKGKVKTNSIHHQCVFEEDLALDLIPTLKVCEKGMNSKVIEGFVHQNLPIAGVQYHPEEIWDDYANAVISHLLTLKQ